MYTWEDCRQPIMITRFWGALDVKTLALRFGHMGLSQIGEVIFDYIAVLIREPTEDDTSQDLILEYWSTITTVDSLLWTKSKAASVLKPHDWLMSCHSVCEPYLESYLGISAIDGPASENKDDCTINLQCWLPPGILQPSIFLANLQSFPNRGTYSP